MNADEYIRLTIGDLMVRLAVLQAHADEQAAKIAQLEAALAAARTQPPREIGGDGNLKKPVGEPVPDA